MDRISDYDTVLGICEDEISLKGSRFIGILMPCPAESDISVCIETVAKRYPNATHYCYAAIFGGFERKEKSSDNGEPSGTAGKPILFMLKGSGLSDAICIVVRYFGGTLLGTGGLVHAYTEGARIALEKAERHSRVACAVFRFTLDYSYYSVFESKCRDLMAKAPKCDYTDKVDVRAWVRVDDEEEFVRRITDLTERHVMLRKADDEYIDDAFPIRKAK
ncbi:MAG: YigZ family protein [Thermoplasmata archaeon]|nr:YigZ family protein [Thermoplasmata archaeon]